MPRAPMLVFAAHWQPYEESLRLAAYQQWRTRVLWHFRPRQSQARRRAKGTEPFAQTLAISGGAMASSVHDFKARTRTSVTLPSGLVVEIRKVTGRDFLGLGELPIPATEVDGARNGAYSPEHVADIRRYSDRAIVRGAVNPRFTEDPDQVESEDAVHLSYLLAEEADYMALAQAILDFSGLTKETAAAVEGFRENEVSEIAESARGEIP